MEVNKENMRLWVAGLLSGKFIQGRNQLSYTDEFDVKKYCCLGVACETAISNGLKVEVKQTYENFTFDGEENVLPLSVMDWLGIDKDDPVLGTLDNYRIIATTANDDMNWDFEEIADELEKYYKL